MTSVPIPLAVPELSGNEREYMIQCLDDNFVSSVGPFVTRFEKEFAAYVGSKFAVACASGTAALHIALRLLDVTTTSRVALPTFTFIASANAAAYQGASCLLVDSERTTWNMDGERLHDELHRRASAGEPLPKVIEVVHVLGHPADLEPVMAAAETFDIPIIEDAAEALGAMYTKGPFGGRQVGTIGVIGCFSFNGNKVITTGGGGMLVTDNQFLAERAKHLTTQAKLSKRGYLHDEVGYNYRLTNVAAALGVAQLERLDEFLAAKRQHAAAYDAALAGLPISVAPRTSWSESTFWLYSVLLDPGKHRDAVLDSLNRAGIAARPLWPPLHRQTPYAQSERVGGTVAEDIYRRGISLPSSVGLTSGERDRVVAALTSAVA